MSLTVYDLQYLVTQLLIILKASQHKTQRLSRQSTHVFAVQSALEESEECGQAEAVHVVDLRQVADHKVQTAAALGQRQVGVSLLKHYTW